MACQEEIDAGYYFPFQEAYQEVIVEKEENLPYQVAYREEEIVDVDEEDNLPYQVAYQEVSAAAAAAAGNSFHVMVASYPDDEKEETADSFVTFDETVPVASCEPSCVALSF